MPRYVKSAPVRTLRGKGDYYAAKARKPATRTYVPKRTYVRAPPSTVLDGHGDYKPKRVVRKKKSVDDRLAGYLETLYGEGDYIKPNYSIKSNTLWNLAEQIPQMHSTGHSTVFRHREYLADITTSSTIGAFKIQSFAINPGFSATFPWLAGIASTSFQKYKIRGMIFEFRSMSAEALNSTNTALGTVIMSTNYSAIDPPFQNKAQMENTDFGMSGRPSQSIVHPIECDPKSTPLSEQYIVNGGENQSRYDPRMDDLGIFYIATQGMQAANVNIGELWVSYDIELITPIQTATLSNAGLVHAVLPYGALTTATLANPFGTAAAAGSTGNLVFRTNTLGMAQNFGGKDLYFTPGAFKAGSYYSIYVNWRGQFATSQDSPSLLATNWVPYNVLDDNTLNYNVWPSQSITLQTAIGAYLIFKVVDPTVNTIFTFNLTTIPNTLIHFDVIITEMSSFLA